MHNLGLGRRELLTTNDGWLVYALWKDLADVEVER